MEEVANFAGTIKFTKNNIFGAVVYFTTALLLNGIKKT